MLLAGAIVLVGCTGGDDPEPTGTAATQGGTAQGATAGTPTGSTAAAPAGVVSGTFPIVGSESGTVDVSIESLTVDGKTLELRAWFTPHDSSAAGDPISLNTMTDDTLRPSLNDVNGLAQYFVLSDTGQEWETDTHDAAAVDGTPVLYQAWFAAPESHAQTLDVQLVASWPPFENVPVTYAG